ncbi:hypothetical protein [Bradyrhizobium sp. BWC-3-1]|uniref:hypothetical protein n=1 Tax=Bradyrhizobium sp. BWC-3-1 TaxID=3080012 RepID=UPI00293E4145|nr:hypothetical protein [Bradyrhizobium sp. BWC-3-1]WOH58508.1 hypothetical protein RX329_41585 [Bradyrhizobium sp. BWC-3-1]
MAFDWTCESIRLSLFSSQTVKLSAQSWTALTGQEEPEQEQKGGGRHVFASTMLGGQFNLGAIANRCDIILSPVTLTEVPEDYIPAVGQWPSALEGFQAHVAPFLEQLSFPVMRMAFAPVLVLPLKERLDAYKALVSLVKSIRQSPENMRDVLLRINWPQNSTAVDGLTLNRITTWSVQQYQIQMFVSDGNSPAAFANELTYGVRLELDHNTDQKHASPFDVSRLVPIYKELTNLALQNATEGEIL